MREIKFRGYAKEELVGGRWLEGFGIKKIEYVDGTSSFYLLTDYGNYEVFESSVGQYIRLKDVNSRKVYEGDKIYVSYSELDGECTERIITVDDITNWELLQFLDFSNSIAIIGNVFEDKLSKEMIK